MDEQLLQWEHINLVANRFKRRWCPLLKAIDFQATAANKSLMTAVQFLKTALQKNRPLTQYKPDKLPRRFIPEKNKPYLYAAITNGKKELLVDRYEFLIYRLLRTNLESGDVFLSK